MDTSDLVTAFISPFFSVTESVDMHKLQLGEEVLKTFLHRITHFHDMIDFQMGFWVWGELMADEVK